MVLQSGSLSPCIGLIELNWSLAVGSHKPYVERYRNFLQTSSSHEDGFPRNEQLYSVHHQSGIHQANDVPFADFNPRQMRGNLAIINFSTLPSEGADLNPIENILTAMITDLKARKIRNLLLKI